MNFLVIDIGGTFTKYAVMDENGTFLEKGKVQTSKKSQDAFVEMLVDLYESCTWEISGIGISSAGMIDSEKGFFYNAGSIFCVKDLCLGKVLEERCHVPVTVENDAKCAAMAELWKGSLKGCKNAALFILGTAVGGAVICDGKVLKGHNLLAGEFSYLLTNAQDAENPEYVLANAGGVPALIKMVSKAKGIPEEKLSGKKIFALADKKDETVLKCLRSYAHVLAVQMNNCQFILNPEKIAVGGGISEQPLLLELIKEELKSLHSVYPYKLPVPEVTACEFFNDSNLIGALYVHLNRKK